jgi:GNAT superfamily N-acetyltransferase
VATEAEAPKRDTATRREGELLVLRPRDAAGAARVLQRAFLDDPAGVALWMPPGASVRVLPSAAAMLAGVFGRGPILPTIAHASRAAWRDRGSMARLARARRQGLAAVTGDPAWYLALIGTDQRFRRRGVARRLLEHVLDRCDADRVPAWLETTEAGNVGIYEHFGFTVTASAAAGPHLPGYWFLWRAPRPAP